MNQKLFNIGISLLSLLLIFGIFETGTRIYFGEYRFTNFLGVEKSLFRSQHPTQFHQELGWIPRKGDHIFITGKDKAHLKESRSKITIMNEGIRSNSSNAVYSSNKSILAIGDSFTFGDGVSDHETWPAQLEKLSGVPVINGGVFGYGLDQSFLRMKMLSNQYKPDIIIFSFIPDNINRCELSIRQAKKPYFIIDGGRLTLQNKHILLPTPQASITNRYKMMMGYSYFIHILMMEKFREFWLQGVNYGKVQVHQQGEKISCLIFDEIRDYSMSTDIPIYVVAQYASRNIKLPDCCNNELSKIRNVLRCIQSPLVKIDLYDSLMQLSKQESQQYESLFTGHMSKTGNLFVAEKIHEELINKKFTQ